MDLVDSLIKDAQRMANDGRPKDALEALDPALEASPEHGLAWFTRGIILAAMGDHADAVASYVEAARREPEKAPLAFFNAGKSLVEIGDLDRALECFGNAHELDPTDRAAVLEHARVLRKLGRFEDAIGQFGEALKLTPTDGRLWHEFADCHVDAGRPAAATACYRKALDHGMTTTEPWDGLVRSRLAIDDVDGALAAITEALAAHDPWTEGWLLRATVLCRLDRFEEAAACVDEAAAREPGSPLVSSTHGDVLRARGEWTTSLKAYDRALAVDADCGPALLGQAEALFACARWGECTLVVVRYLELDPKHPRANELLIACTKKSVQA